MLKTYLQEVKKNIVFLFSAKKIDGVILNKSVFGQEIPTDLKAYKKEFLVRMKEKKINLMKIREDVYAHEENFLHRDVLETELDYQIEVINFLVYTYDIEAKKLDPNYEIEDNVSNIDYDHFNKTFWGIDKSYLDQEFDLNPPETENLYFTKNEVIYLLEAAKLIIPKIRYDFGDYPNLAFNGGLLKIHDHPKFHVKDVISLVFHEFVHFFRYENGKRNLGFFYSLSDYPTLEEGIAIYNEIQYGNRLMNYGQKQPVYDRCFQFLLEDISEEEKLEKITKLLRVKGYNKEKARDYYNRFYRFSQIGSKDFYLKDVIYTVGYDNVVKLLEEDPENYERILAGRVGIHTIRKGIITPEKNLDSKAFFDEMEQIFKRLLEKKRRDKIAAEKRRKAKEDKKTKK